ncbi:MAG: XrtA/PEP-CTERM system amidotransferase [Pseudomonadota bacterium]
MCGIAGLYDLDQQRHVERDLLTRMTRAVSHRGPDGEGLHTEPGVGLGHRRLSIIDLEGGAQPMWNAEEDVVVTYNGEIYNFAALREELIAAGHRFRTRSDTEVIIHGWREWGEACVERFNGMFAFAIFDRRQQCLFLARDRLGIKPLYYSVLDDGWVLFGSELKSLYAHPGLDRSLSTPALEEYFAFGYVPEPRTFLEKSFKLPPAHTLTLRRGEPVPAPREYWTLSFEVAPGFDGKRDAAAESALEQELIERLRTAVDRRLVAEVPLGAFLSGGVDSSAVVAMMAGLDERAAKTCSIAFGEADYDESKFAQMVAERYQTDHRVQQVDPEDFDLVNQLAEVYDEPYADSSAIPTYRVCELARREVTVALSGDGGDEGFAGYRRHRWHAWEEQIRGRVPPLLRGPLFGTAGAIYPKMDWAPRFLRAKSTLQALGRDALAGYLHSVSIFPAELRRKLFSGDVRQALGGYEAVEVFRRHAAEATVDHPLSLVQYLDFKTYLPGDILTKVDRASMAHGLEVRVPLLDHEFVQWSAQLPASLKLRGREGKYVLKKALEPHLPNDVLYRPKMGFAVPLGRWFRGPLAGHVRDAVTGPELRDLGLFEPSMLKRLVDEHQSGQREHTAVLWALLMFRGAIEQLAQPATTSRAA